MTKEYKIVNTGRLVIIVKIMVVLLALASVSIAAEDDKLDLNKATVETLSDVPGLNQDLAEKIIELRDDYGEFVDMEELLDVEGIDNNLLRSLKQHVFIDDITGCGNC